MLKKTKVIILEKEINIIKTVTTKIISLINNNLKN